MRASDDFVAPIPTAPTSDDHEIENRLRRALRARETAPIQSLEERVVFRLNIGLGIDAGLPNGCTADNLTCQATNPQRAELLSGAVLDESSLYEQVRVYSFGDAVIGTRGLVVPSLSTYMAAQFRVDQGASKPSSAAPTVYDRSDRVLVRSGYAEMDRIFAAPHLQPFFARAGRMFRYGPVIAHFDGALIGYQKHALALAAYVGQRVDLYGTTSTSAGLISGFDARCDLQPYTGIPLSLAANALSFDHHSHLRTSATYQLSRDVVIGFDARLLDAALAREALRLRARISQVTTLHAEIENRSASDMVYDLFLIDMPSDPTDVRRYLSLGPALPRVHLNVRAGTVLLDNVDILLRLAGAFEHDNRASGPFAPSFVETGAAAEVRLRDVLSLGASLTVRRYFRPQLALPDTQGIPDPLPLTTAIFGERSFFETGAQVRYSAGARVFSAALESYVRIYDPQQVYQVPDRFESLDTRAGGLFRVEGWVAPQLRLRAEYDVTFSLLRLAPELRALRALRVLLEASF
jgi:hypothetical protein